MRGFTYYAVTIAAGALIALGGCQMLGPKSIDVGRGRYNSIIQTTSMEQTMSNIVRVYNHEPPMFMDVTEVDATVAFTGSVTGASTNIGARHGANNSTATVAGQVGMASGTLQYSETPTIRYQPLLGQALVAQLVTPVSVDALGLLYDSNWHAAPLFDFSVQYMTLDPHEFYAALDTLEELAGDEAVELAAAPTNMPKPPPPSGDDDTGTKSKTTKMSAPDNDSLVVYLLPLPASADFDSKKRILQLWVRMFRFYSQNQPPFEQPAAVNCAALGLNQLNDQNLQKWDANINQYFVEGTDADKDKKMRDAFLCLPNFVELRVVPAPIAPKSAGAGQSASTTNGKRTKSQQRADNDKSVSVSPPIATHVPLMRTFSALGILKNATERPHPLIEFVKPDRYRKIRFDEKWNGPVDELDYYTLLPEDLDSIDCPSGGCDSAFPANMPKSAIGPLDADITHWLQSYDPTSTKSFYPILNSLEHRQRTDNSQDSGSLYPNGISVYEKSGDDILGNEYLARNGRLGTLKRFILVVVDDQLPSEPVYASYTDGERWYYIPKGDAVSEKNFQLLSLFMSMMAIPPSTQPLSPVINVGAQ